MQQGHRLEASLDKIDALSKQKNEIAEQLIPIINVIWKNEPKNLNKSD